MTKTVQANVLRAYQPGEQYVSGEICTYNGVPSYVNTALAQGVTGSASNFTNIGNRNVYSRASAGNISIAEGSNPMVIYMDSTGITTITINITQAGLIDLNKLIKIRLIGIGFNGSTAGAASIVLAYSGFPVGSNRNVWVRRSSTDSIGTNITGASGTSSGLSITVLAGETIDIVITGGQSTNDSIYIDAATNSQSRVLDGNFTIGKTNSTFGHKFSIPAITDNRTITLPDANVNLGNIAQAASTSTTGYLTSTDWNTFNSKEFVDSTFRVKDNTDATKKIAFEASPVGTGQVRTITMPNADVNLTSVAGMHKSAGLKTVTKQFYTTFPNGVTTEKYLTTDGSSPSFIPPADPLLFIPLPDDENTARPVLVNIKGIGYSTNFPAGGTWVFQRRIIVGRGTENGVNSYNGLPRLETVSDFTYGQFNGAVFLAGKMDNANIIGSQRVLQLAAQLPNNNMGYNCVVRVIAEIIYSEDTIPDSWL